MMRRTFLPSKKQTKNLETCNITDKSGVARRKTMNYCQFFLICLTTKRPKLSYGKNEDGFPFNFCISIKAFNQCLPVKQEKF